MNRATDAMRDSAAELVSRRCGDGSAARCVVILQAGAGSDNAVPSAWVFRRQCVAAELLSRRCLRCTMRNRSLTGFPNTKE
jgi:hypothetical protein